MTLKGRGRDLQHLRINTSTTAQIAPMNLIYSCWKNYYVFMAVSILYFEKYFKIRTCIWCLALEYWGFGILVFEIEPHKSTTGLNNGSRKIHVAYYTRVLVYIENINSEAPGIASNIMLKIHKCWANVFTHGSLQKATGWTLENQTADSKYKEHAWHCPSSLEKPGGKLCHKNFIHIDIMLIFSVIFKVTTANLFTKNLLSFLTANPLNLIYI